MEEIAVPGTQKDEDEKAPLPRGFPISYPFKILRLITIFCTSVVPS